MIRLALAALVSTGIAAAPLPSPAAGAPAPSPARVLQASPTAEPDTTPEPGSELRVWLLTAGPGDAVWERFGHNALRVLDTSTGRDVAYNWGIFDFNQVDFIPRFLKGQMLYMMASFRTAPMVEAYAGTGRRLVLQELNLTPAQKRALRDFAEWNALPQNREYYYNYFLDNCSTRVRDLLNQVLGGALKARFGEMPSQTTWRDQIRRLTRDDPLLFTGMDVLLGTPGDAPITVWQEMFLPMTLRDHLRGLTVMDEAGGTSPLVLSEDVVAPGDLGPEPEAPPSWFVFYLALGLALAALLGWSGERGRGGARWGRALATTLATVWSLVAGFVGTLLALVLLTDHTFMYGNENLFLLTPLSLALVVLLPWALWSPGAQRAARRVAGVVMGVALVGMVVQLLPAFHQHNAIFQALVLPVHIVLWWWLRPDLQDLPSDAAGAEGGA